MTPQKRKAVAALPAEASDESPYKRARSESTGHTTHKQNGTGSASEGSPDDQVEHSVTPVQPSSHLQAARGTNNEDAPFRELPQSWDQADTADQMLVNMKETKNSWATIEQGWERLTGAKPAEGMLPDRHRQLKDIMAHSKAGGALGEKIESKAVEEPLKTSNDISALPTTKVGPSSPAIGGSSNTSGDTPNYSKPAVYPSDPPNAAPTTVAAPEQDIPQSWEQANAGDQLIVRMKTSRPSWAKIEEAWQNLTGEKPAEGAIKDRYMAIRDLVIRPETTRAYKRTHPAKASNLDEASDHVISQRAKPTLRTPRKGKAKAEPSEESLNESSDEASDESSDEVSRPSITTTRRKPCGAVQRQMRVSAFDGPSIEPISERTKTTAKEPSNSRAEAGSSNESDEDSKHSITLAKSVKRPRVKPAVAAGSGAQNMAETPDEMVVEMRERGCSWVEIGQAWTERTGRVNAPDTLRKRYGRIKLGSAANIKSATQASGKRKAKANSPEEASHDSSAKRSKPTAETPSKRNMDRGKRKHSVKYTDSTTDEDELFAAPVEPVVTASAKRNAGRTRKVNRSDPEWLVTNEKSPLACEDLHAEFSNPKTYENFTKSDWEDLRETLPPSVPINPDGYSIPMTFFKYDSDFRRGIREFQEDLASGRLDPKWQSDAAQAMEERARGEFDAYKEDQFEAFWGQKQKLSHDAVAGESMKIKLDFLIQNKVFKVGDYFSYSRVFGRGKNGVLVEKDCKVSEVHDLCPESLLIL